jgi:hypothetical protein
MYDCIKFITKKAWEISENTGGDKEKIQALSLAKDCVINKLELLTNATVAQVIKLKSIPNNKVLCTISVRS